MRLLFLFVLATTFWWGTAHFLKSRGSGLIPRQLWGLLAGLLAVLTFAVVLVNFVLPSNPNSIKAAATASLPEETRLVAAPSAVPPASPAAIVVAGADEILGDYRGNEVAGDLKYKGKDVLLYGDLDRVERDGPNGIVVRVGGSMPFASVWSYLASGQEAEAARLVRGKIVHLQCKGDGVHVNIPVFRECTVQH
jgi:tRNA_anti-like